MTSVQPTAASPFARHWVSLLIGAIISIAALVLVFRQVDFDSFWQHIRQADTYTILAMILVYLSTLFARTRRWQTLAREPISFWPAFHLINISYLLNAVLPLRLGDLSRILLMSRQPGQTAASGLSALTVERLLDLSFALLCLGIGLFFLPEGAALPAETSSTVGLMIIVTISGILLLLVLRRTHPLLLRLVHLITSFFPASLAQRLNAFIEDTFRSLQVAMQWQRLLYVLLWSTLLWAGYTGYFQLGLYAFTRQQAPLEIGLLTLGIVALGVAAPSLPGAIGVFQAAAVLALRINDYDTSVATSYAWSIWAIETAIIIGVGIVSLWAIGMSFRRLTNEVSRSLDQGLETVTE